MCGDGLRDRKPKAHGKELNGDADVTPERDKTDKTYGRTPDGSSR